MVTVTQNLTILFLAGGSIVRYPMLVRKINRIPDGTVENSVWASHWLVALLTFFSISLEACW